MEVEKIRKRFFIRRGQSSNVTKIPNVKFATVCKICLGGGGAGGCGGLGFTL